MTTPAGMSDLERLVAEADIRQLVARYAVALDRRDLETLVSLFVSDVRVARDIRGHAALLASFDSQLRTVGMTVLNVGTHQIDLAGPDDATGHVYCKAEIQDGDRWIHQAIRYDDTYSRVDGQWRFVRRQHLLFYGAEVGVNPLGLPPADWPTNHDGLGTIPHDDPTWQAFHRDDPGRTSP